MLMCTPLIAMWVVYVVLDPFKVVRHHDEFYPDEVVGGVSLNPGYVSCSVYDRQAETYGYDSFVFGNSRSIYYSLSEWTGHLDSCRCAMHFDAAAESLLGIVLKMEWIDSRGGELRNVLLVVDADLLARSTANVHSHLLMLAPQLDTPVGRMRFQMQNFRTFINPKFLRAYIDFKMSGTLKPYMVGEKLLNDDMFTYDPVHNEMDFGIMERCIDEGKYYNEARVSVFDGVQHPDSVSPPVIGDEHKALLARLKAVVDRHHTDVQCIVSPLYNQIRLNPQDIKTLSETFGSERVHDFSGPNQWNADYHNYYEASHYRPHVANEVMRRVYASQSPVRQ